MPPGIYVRLNLMPRRDARDKYAAKHLAPALTHKIDAELLEYRQRISRRIPDRDMLIVEARIRSGFDEWRLGVVAHPDIRHPRMNAARVVFAEPVAIPQLRVRVQLA